MREYSKTIDIYGDEIGSVDYVDSLGSDLTVVNAARVSFGDRKDELDNRDKRLIKYLINHRHTSTLEHNVVTFRFIVPLFVRSQHHRHRTWSYNEISRRYTDKNLRFYEPKNFRTQHKSNRQASNPEDKINPMLKLYDPACSHPVNILASRRIEQYHREALTLFDDLLAGGICREQARGVLPQNLYTEYYGTVNLNNLLKFIDLRTHEGAQWEIQKVAEACLEIVTDLWPVTVNSYRSLRCGAPPEV
jgi:thymidylate synthase (FAD)